VQRGDDSFRQHWDGAGTECTVELRDSRQRADETVLDVVFVIDTTGSMSDEIDRIKGTLLSVTERLRSLDLEFDLRYGAVLYRDIGDEYLTKTHPFTSDLAAFDTALQQIEANGGGDGPESLNQGLAVAIDEMEWRDGAAHLAFLIADAPPHLDYENDVPYDRSLLEAVARGIRVHAVAASGLPDVGSLVFRQIAQFTRGEFVFIEYGGDSAASAADHGVSKPTASNNLDEILFARIRDEIARWGRPRA
jgi:Mg-chelatase subunit ChlD